AIDDSLNCTTDVIDEDCTFDEADGRIDLIHKSSTGCLQLRLQKGPGHNRLKTLLRAIPCWSLEDFIFCCEEQLGLTHIQNLLYTEISRFECT
ncbi:hypothetical protein NPIL_351051, partial [Nephila pilipes]